MSISKSKSLVLCSLIGGLAALSGCSDNDPANVSFAPIDTSPVPSNVIPNSDFSQSDTDWVGWRAEVDESSSVEASFTLVPASSVGSNSQKASSRSFGGSGNLLKASIINVEADSLPEDASAGPAAVPVKPGQAYGVAAQLMGPACGLTQFVVRPEGDDDPENIIKVQNIFLNGQPQLVEFYFQAPEGVTSVDMPVQLGFADNVGGEFYFDRMVAMPIPTLPREQEGNVAKNSDFEDSDTDINVDASWGQSGSGATFTLNTDPEHSQSGNNSVKIVFDDTVGTGDPWDIEAGPIGVPTVAGWTYEFSAWYKGEPGATINFLVQNPNTYTVYEQQSTAPFMEDEWQEVRFEVLIPDTNVVRLFAQYNFPDNAGKTIYIDNIRLIPPATCPYSAGSGNLVSANEDLFEYNHVVNGGLENDLLEPEGWRTVSLNGAAAEFEMQLVGDELNRTLVNTGYQSLKTTITTVANEPTDIQVGPADLYVVPGGTYIYSGHVRGPAGAQASFTPVMADAPSTSMEGVLVQLNNLWQQISFDFTVPSDAPVLTAAELEEAGFEADAQIVRLNMAANLGYPENVGRHIYLDDFSLLPNAIRNGDLEDSATVAEGWTMQASSDLASIALDTQEAHTGDNSLRVSISSKTTALIDDKDPTSFSIQPEDIQAGVENIPVVGGHKYYVSARFNGDAGSRVKLLLGSTDGTVEYGAAGGADGNEDGRPDGVELTGGWQEITFAVNVPEGVEEVSLMAQMGFATNALRTIYLDTFRLVSQIPPLPKKATANQIENGDFETGEAAGWSENNVVISVVDKADNPDGVYSGRYALYVDQRQGAWASAQYDLGADGLAAGTTYFASVWVRLDNSEGAVADKALLKVRVDYSDDTSDYLSVAESADDADTFEWTRLSSVFTFNPAPGKTISSIRPYIETLEAPERTENHTSYYLDDLLITKVFNKNGGFESDMEDWNPAGADVTIVDGAGRSQSKAARITNRTNGWSSVQYNMGDIGLVPGHTYLVSAWVKWDSADAPEDIKMTIEQEDEAGNANRWRTIARTTNAADWVQLSNTFTYLPNGDVNTLKVYFEATGPDLDGNGDPGAGGVYFVDDLIITELTPPPTLIVNGDLEMGDATGWEASSGALGVVQWPSGGAHSGFFGLQVSAGDSALYSLQELELQAQTSYRASVWVKIAGAGAADTVSLKLRVNDGRADPYINIASAETSSDGWVLLEGFVDYAPANSDAEVSLVVEADEASTSFFVDDLVLVRNYAFNGRMEVSDTETLGWVNSGDAQLSISTTSYEGDHSLFVTGRTQRWNSAQQDLVARGMELGKTYEISAWVKIDGDTPSVIKMTLESAIGDAGSAYTQLDEVRDTSDWVKLSARYTLDFDEMPSVLKVYFEADELDEEGKEPPVLSSYYVDSLVITEVEETYTH